MIPVTRLRAGTSFKLKDKLYRVLEYKHTALGRGQATIRVKVRDLETGEVGEKVFSSGAKVEPIETETKRLQYLYQDEDDFYFVDPRSFEQFSLKKKSLGEKRRFLKEGKEIKVVFFQNRPLSIELPVSLVFEVVETSPGVKGDTVSAGTKPAKLDNGLVVKVPLFIKKGDKVKIDTRTGEYIERVK